MFNIWVMLLFGVIGYVFKKLDYPLAPLILALVLGDQTEVSFRQAILGSQGAIEYFLFKLACRRDYDRRAPPAVLAGDCIFVGQTPRSLIVVAGSTMI